MAYILGVSLQRRVHRHYFFMRGSSTRHSIRLQSQQKKGTVYVHWPFCSKLCSYCNFNKYIRPDVDDESMTKCLVREVQSLLKMSSISHVTSIYFGGGTPSLTRPSTIEAVINAVANVATLYPYAEVSLEANPTSAELKKLRDFRTAGINRLSLGIQSLVDADLILLNRNHIADQSKSVLRVAKQLFPDHVSVDLIFGRPQQTVDSWVEELKQMVNICSTHLSLYQLTVEQGTALSRAVNTGDIVLPNSEIIADMYEAAVNTLQDLSFHRYEVSNFSQSGYESRHNLAYWEGSDYVGIGPGAHSCFKCSDGTGFVHSINILEPVAWMKRVESDNHGIKSLQRINVNQRLEEVMVSSLRTSSGLTNEIWKAFSPKRLQEVFDPSTYENTNVYQYIRNNLLVIDESGIRATSKGLQVLDSILPECCAILESRHL